METKYGYIAIITEDGKMKINWEKCNFKSPCEVNFLNFCGDTKLHNELNKIVTFAISK